VNEAQLYRRIGRRETHRSRSTAVVVILVLVSLGAIYVAIECALAALGDAPLLVAPADAVSAVNSKASWLPWAGAGAIVFGLVALLLGVLPSRRARHTLDHDRLVVVVDDGVLAGAFAGATRRAVDVAPDRVRASVSARSVVVSVTPTSGVPLAQADAEEASERLLADLAVRPRLRSRVAVASSGVVGS
jgi:hypothetical protein